MARPTVVTSIAKVFCVLGASCQAMLGTVDVTPAPAVSAPVTGSVEDGAAPVRSGAASSTQTSPGGPVDMSVGGALDTPVGGPELNGAFPLSDAGPASGSESGHEGVEVDAGPPPLIIRPVLVDDSVSELARVGVDGGQPRLGACLGGVVVGIRPTANPSEGVFGQRLTFIEPICGKLGAVSVGTIADPTGVAVSLTRDDSILNWDDSGDFQGTPSTVVPDPRLIWIPQPETLCPDTAPVLAGLSGEYDPTAPDVTDTAAIRSMTIECAPLVVAANGIDVMAAGSGHQFISQADSFAAAGTDTYRSSCGGGAVTTQIQVSAGFWLDGFVLGCSGLRSPRLGGEPCSGELECQSGACLGQGVCAP